tara:strand:- start:806 stop:1744 length:939 start_codon:yes stop_codon:yes gene_type:complete
MKISPIEVLINGDFEVDKKFYFISGNEKTLMEKIKSKFIEKLQKNEGVQFKNIETIGGFVDEPGLFEDKNIIIVSGYKGIDQENLKSLKETKNYFIFLQENSQKIKKIKNIFGLDKDSYLVDCYELDREAKVKIFNNFINMNKLDISKEVYWFLIDRLDNKYIFFENNLIKILELNTHDITLENIKKILTLGDSGKEKIFFNLLKKNNEIVELYRNKIITNSDVNDFYYYSKFFCQLIIDCNSEDEYNRKIPVYLFREKKYLIDIFRKYNSKKKKMLLKLLSSTELILRKESGLSLIAGLRYILNIKKITIS